MSLEQLKDAAAFHLTKIERLFEQTPKITLIIRTPWLTEKGLDGGVLLTNEEGDAGLDLAIAELHRLRKKPAI